MVSGGLGISLHIARSEYGGMMGFDLATSLAVGLDLVLTIWTSSLVWLVTSGSLPITSFKVEHVFSSLSELVLHANFSLFLGSRKVTSIYELIQEKTRFKRS